MSRRTDEQDGTGRIRHLTKWQTQGLVASPPT
jgi:hypothetical protein